MIIDIPLVSTNQKSSISDYTYFIQFSNIIEIEVNEIYATCYSRVFLIDQNRFSWKVHCLWTFAKFFSDPSRNCFAVEGDFMDFRGWLNYLEKGLTYQYGSGSLEYHESRSTIPTF